MSHHPRGRANALAAAVIGFMALVFSVPMPLKAAPGEAPALDVHTGIQYTESGTPELIDIYEPKDAASADRPAVVYIHGGGWAAGGRGGVAIAAAHFIGRGYVFCSIDYRLTGEAKFPAQIEDCKCAIRFLRAHASQYHIDPNRIGVWGDSAGGHLAALLGTTAKVPRLEGKGGWETESSAVEAVLDCYGPANLEPEAFTDYKNPQGEKFLHQFLGDPIDPKLAHDASPIKFITKGDPPFLILHGDKDDLVPVEQSQAFYDALKAAGNDATLKIIPGAGHGGSQFFSLDNILLIDGFFERTLKPSTLAKSH